jgi:hypothetical protein
LITIPDHQFYQYEICFPNEYTKDLLKDVGSLMKMSIDMDYLENILKNDGKPGSQCVAIFRNIENDEFILADCQNRDYLYGLVVRCNQTNNELVKSSMLKWDTQFRREYHQEALTDLDNNMDNPNNLLHSIIRDHEKEITHEHRL